VRVAGHLNQREREPTHGALSHWQKSALYGSLSRTRERAGVRVVGHLKQWPARHPLAKPFPCPIRPIRSPISAGIAEDIEHGVQAAPFDLPGRCRPWRPAILVAMPVTAPNPHPIDHDADRNAEVREPRRWRADGWTARVIKNEDDEGWAVAMTRDGEAEPALVGPWTMGRDKKNPKPLDGPAFSTLVKTASEVLRRHEQQLHADLHKSVTVSAGASRIKVTLDIEPDEDNPSALLRAFDAAGAELAQTNVAPGFKLTAASAAAWIANEFRKPA
jgi:hypothetical protein